MRTRRRIGTALAAAGVGSLLLARPAAADTATRQFTFTHTSGQRVTCSFEGAAFRFGEHEVGHVGAYTRVTSTDPRCEASVLVSLSYVDTYGNEQSSQATSKQQVYLDAYRVQGGITSGHEVHFWQCSGTCWTGFQLNPK
jgi:hypothetical protein